MSGRTKPRRSSPRRTDAPPRRADAPPATSALPPRRSSPSRGDAALSAPKEPKQYKFPQRKKRPRTSERRSGALPLFYRVGFRCKNCTAPRRGPPPPAKAAHRRSPSAPIAVRVLRLPVPEGGAHIVQPPLAPASAARASPCPHRRSRRRCRPRGGGLTVYGSLRPHALSKAWITSSTLYPMPVPRL